MVLNKRKRQAAVRLKAVHIFYDKVTSAKASGIYWSTYSKFLAYH
jgi:hypothetical protein